MKTKIKQYKNLKHLRQRSERLSHFVMKAENKILDARAELWCLYSQEQLLENKRSKRGNK